MLSYGSLGDNGKGIVKLANSLANMMENVTDRVASIAYAFTKFPKDDRNVCAKLTNIRDISKQNEELKTNEAFMSILNDMIEKIKENVLFVDPITGDRVKLINRFLDMPKITLPENVLKFSLGEKSKAKLLYQAQLDKSNVQIALRENNLLLVGHYLTNLKCMSELTQQEFVRDLYNEAKKNLEDALNQVKENAMTKINQALTSQDGLSAEDIAEYRRQNYLSDGMQAIIKDHFKQNEIISSRALIQNVIDKLQETRKELENVELSDKSIEIFCQCVLH